MTLHPAGILTFILPFFITVTALLVLRRIAEHIDLLDRPCERKQHEGLVPLVGGIAMFCGFAVSALVLQPTWTSLALVLIAGVVLVMGILDDMHGLQTRKRFLVQILAAVAMVYIGQVQITHLGNLFGDGEVHLGGFFALIFTVFSTVGVINAMNMVDGADGLAGSLALVSFAALSVIAISAGAGSIGIYSLILVGALTAFLLFNVRIAGRRARVFMGDAGSMMLGLLMAWLFIDLSQGEQPPLSAVSAGWIFGLPLLDISAVMVRRLFEGRSPFEAGRDHLHHLLIDQGFSVNSALAIMCFAHIVFVSVGLLANQVPGAEPLLFWAFVILVAAHLVLTPRLLQTRQRQHVRVLKKSLATNPVSETGGKPRD
ncbi:undecaprenyl/decaprenyl-phosphate alpha-N-acetylglucosaminyl 1-phosphate transferase [Granulosicoccaceae sp. 1_MG-2023]|nr:undecaprenyl/decaprenyl-phosphate alpha-N-acetylglucosaminyl 1-phosphate transferase [Granulosicoccaceae sp. 1_MG-2023]